MNKNLLIVLGILLAVIVVGMFLMSRPKPEEQGQPTLIPQATIESSSEGVREISISASEYSFDPPEITLKSGERVRLTLTNKGRMSHDLVIEELGVRTKEISSGKSDTIEFTVPEADKLTFFCSVGDHRALGMEGKFTIEQ